jgi:hypothetical protein
MNMALLTRPYKIEGRDTPSSVSCVLSRLLVVFSLIVLQPIGILYRPAEAKAKNTRLRDFMGKAVRFHLCLF